MNQYVTETIIKKLREEKNMTQAELAQKLGVSDKAVSKWETGKGYPDITLIEPIAQAMGISSIELLSGNNITNSNRSFNMLRGKFYVCPVCGNVFTSTGEAVISCCGVTLPPLAAEECDEEHIINIHLDDNEYYVTLDHSMTKTHFISFIAAVSDIGVEIIKLYPEGAAEARIKLSRTKYVYAYCNKHGLYRAKIQRR